jgi:hypothetical protein
MFGVFTGLAALLALIGFSSGVAAGLFALVCVALAAGLAGLGLRTWIGAWVNRRARLLHSVGERLTTLVGSHQAEAGLGATRTHLVAATSVPAEESQVAGLTRTE